MGRAVEETERTAGRSERDAFLELVDLCNRQSLFHPLFHFPGIARDAERVFAD